MLGIDVSDFQPSVDWNAVKAAGARFAWSKASEGVSFVAKTYQSHRDGARAAGIRHGAYHFARPDRNTPEAEAKHFMATLGSLAERDLRPALDFEHPGSANAAWAQRWLSLVKQNLRVEPVFYTFTSYLRSMAGQAAYNDLKRWPLWLADFGPNDGARHPVRVPSGFRMVAHQYTSRGHLPGIPALTFNEMPISALEVTNESPKAAEQLEAALSGFVDLDYADSLEPLLASAKEEPETMTLPEFRQYRSWRDWRLAGADPAKRPTGIPRTIPKVWWSAYKLDQRSFKLDPDKAIKAERDRLRKQMEQIKKILGV